MPEAQAITEPYAWLAWLGEKDAHVLLLTLMQSIEGTEYPGLQHPASIEDLRWVVSGWRRNALKALDAEDYTAQVDGYLEVRVDARMVRLTRQHRDADDAADELEEVIQQLTTIHGRLDALIASGKLNERVIPVAEDHDAND